MVFSGQTERQLSLGISPAKAVQGKPAPMRVPASIQNSAQLRMEVEEFLLSKMNSSFNSFLSFLEKARPGEPAKYLRSEFCRILSPRAEGEKAILSIFPSKAQMGEANLLIRSIECFPSNPRNNKKEGKGKWWFAPDISDEEQNLEYARERFSAMFLLLGLNSFFEKREYGKFILILDLYEKDARKAVEKKREYGKPRVSKYEVFICKELQLGISGKVNQLAETNGGNQPLFQ